MRGYANEFPRSPFVGNWVNKGNALPSLLAHDKMWVYIVKKKKKKKKKKRRAFI